MCTNCPCRYSFKYKKALETKRNVPRKCSVPMCPASAFTLNIKYHVQLVHPGLDPKTIEVSDWVLEKQIARRAQKTKAEKGEKVRRITIHVDKEAQEGMGQATTMADEAGDKYGTQRRTSEADEESRIERRVSDESDRSHTDSSPTTNSSSGGMSSTSSESSSESSSSHSSAKVVVATGHKKAPSNPAGKASKRKVGRHVWQLQWHISDKHQNGSRVATPKGSGRRRLCEVHKQVHKTLRYEGGLGTNKGQAML